MPRAPAERLRPERAQRQRDSLDEVGIDAAGPGGRGGVLAEEGEAQGGLFLRGRERCCRDGDCDGRRLGHRGRARRRIGNGLRGCGGDHGAGGRATRTRRGRTVGPQCRQQHAFVGALDGGAANIFDPDPGEALATEIEEMGSAMRQVDHAIAMERTAVVDADDERMAVGQVGDSGVARHRHGPMSGRERIHVIDFAVGSEPAMELASVPRGDARLGMALALLEGGVGPPGDTIGPADAVDAATPRHGLALGNHSGAGTDTVALVEPIDGTAVRRRLAVAAAKRDTEAAEGRAGQEAAACPKGPNRHAHALADHRRVQAGRSMPVRDQPASPRHP